MATTNRRVVVEIAAYGLMIAIASYLAVQEWKFWAGFVAGTFCTMVTVNLVLAKPRAQE